VFRGELAQQNMHHTVAYVPSPSFSSCWKELGCLLSIFAAGFPVPRFCTLIVLGTDDGICRAVGVGGKVRKGGGSEVRCCFVYLGSHRREEGVQRFSRIANASFDTCEEAVVESEEQVGCVSQYNGGQAGSAGGGSTQP
jgi:hypothetical protein